MHNMRLNNNILPVLLQRIFATFTVTTDYDDDNDNNFYIII